MSHPIHCEKPADPIAVDYWLEANTKANSSQFWLDLNKRNIEQLKEYGYENFKRTVALNYFTWIIGFGDEQFSFLRSHLPRATVLKCLSKSVFSQKISLFTRKKSVQCKFLTYLYTSMC